MWNIRKSYTAVCEYIDLQVSLQCLWGRPSDATEARIKYSTHTIARHWRETYSMMVVLIKHILCCLWEVPTIDATPGMGNIARDLDVGKSLQCCNSLTRKTIFLLVYETLYMTTRPSTVSCDVWPASCATVTERCKSIMKKHLYFCDWFSWVKTVLKENGMHNNMFICEITKAHSRIFDSKD